MKSNIWTNEQGFYLIFLLFCLGFLIDFVSGPVSVGFTSAAAIIIATTQMKDILGLPYPGGDFVIIWEQIFQHISETSLPDAALGVGTIIVLLLLRVSINSLLSFMEININYIITEHQELQYRIRGWWEKTYNSIFEQNYMAYIYSKKYISSLLNSSFSILVRNPWISAFQINW